MRKLIVVAMLLLTACDEESLTSLNNILDNVDQMQHCGIGSDAQSRKKNGCDEKQAARDYDVCLSKHDRYVCEPFREKAGGVRDAQQVNEDYGECLEKHDYYMCESFRLRTQR
ncbi:MAG: hypothetical protein V4735_03900 [Pseudomonadota bacterium]